MAPSLEVLFVPQAWEFVVPDVGEDAAAVVTRCMVGLLIAECWSRFTLSGSPDH